MENYEYMSTVGEGAYGYVWKCRDRNAGKVVAVKGFKQAHEDPEIMRLALREVRILKATSYMHTVHLLEAFKSKSGRVYLVFEYVERNVFSELERFPTGLPSSMNKLVLWQLLHAVSYLHANKIVHRDIKPANILLTSDNVLKLCDFGFARFVNGGARDAQRLSSYVVTRWYRAPEVLVSDHYGPAADIWALGCTFAELATGRPLFPGKSTVDQLWLIMRCLGPLGPQQAARLAKDTRLQGVTVPALYKTLRQRLHGVDAPLLHLISACLHPDPQRRPTAQELLQAPYFWEIPRLISGTPLEKMHPEVVLGPNTPPVHGNRPAATTRGSAMAPCATAAAADDGITTAVAREASQSAKAPSGQQPDAPHSSASASAAGRTPVQAISPVRPAKSARTDGAMASTAHGSDAAEAEAGKPHEHEQQGIPRVRAVAGAEGQQPPAVAAQPPRDVRPTHQHGLMAAGQRSADSREPATSSNLSRLEVGSPMFTDGDCGGGPSTSKSDVPYMCMTAGSSGGPTDDGAGGGPGGGACARQQAVSASGAPNQGQSGWSGKTYAAGMAPNTMRTASSCTPGTGGGAAMGYQSPAALALARSAMCHMATAPAPAIAAALASQPNSHRGSLSSLFHPTDGPDGTAASAEYNRQNSAALNSGMLLSLDMSNMPLPEVGTPVGAPDPPNCVGGGGQRLPHRRAPPSNGLYQQIHLNSYDSAAMFSPAIALQGTESHSLSMTGGLGRARDASRTTLWATPMGGAADGGDSPRDYPGAAATAPDSMGGGGSCGGASGALAQLQQSGGSQVQRQQRPHRSSASHCFPMGSPYGGAGGSMTNGVRPGDAVFMVAASGPPDGLLYVRQSASVGGMPYEPQHSASAGYGSGGVGGSGSGAATPRSASRSGMKVAAGPSRLRGMNTSEGDALSPTPPSTSELLLSQSSGFGPLTSATAAGLATTSTSHGGRPDLTDFNRSTSVSAGRAAGSTTQVLASASANLGGTVRPSVATSSSIGRGGPMSPPAIAEGADEGRHSMDGGGTNRGLSKMIKASFKAIKKALRPSSSYSSKKEYHRG